jgi:hypothetical protein
MPCTEATDAACRSDGLASVHGMPRARIRRRRAGSVYARQILLEQLCLIRFAECSTTRIWLTYGVQYQVQKQVWESRLLLVGLR